MTTDHPRLEAGEVPLRAGCTNHFLGIYAKPIEDHRRLIHQRNVQVTVRVFENFTSDRAIDAGHQFRYCTARTRNDLGDSCQGVVAITRVDPLR